MFLEIYIFLKIFYIITLFNSHKNSVKWIEKGILFPSSREEIKFEKEKGTPGSHLVKEKCYLNNHFAYQF